MNRFWILTVFLAQCAAGATATNAVRAVRIGALNPQRDHVTNVRTQGTVVDVFSDDLDPMYDVLMLKDGSDLMPAFVPRVVGAEAARRATWLDAEVSVEGVYENHIEGERQFTGPFVGVHSAECVRVVTPAPAPFAVPELVLPSHYVSADAVLRLGRRRVTGEVLAAWNGNRMLVRANVAHDDDTKPYVLSRTPRIVGVELHDTAELPASGAHVTVDGYPTTDVFLHLRKARFRVEADGPAASSAAETPVRTTPREIVRHRRGRPTFTLRDHGKLVTITGVVRSTPAENDANRRLILECEGDLVPVDASAHPDTFADVVIGCVVDVTGVCVLESTGAGGLDVFPRITGFTLVPRDARDVRVVDRPPWWTPARLLVLIAVLALALVAFLVWNVLLRRLADRRGRELAHESIARAASQLKLDERTRLAAELHDSIAQNLTGASMELRTAKRALAADATAAADHLDFALKAIDASRGDVRNCIWDLRNRALDAERLDEAVRTTLQPHLGGAQLAVRFFVPRNRLSDSAAHALLCALRELSVNAFRHGGAKRLRIAGVVDGDVLKCSVRDDGCGFDPARAPGMEQGHFGLQGVRERVRGLKGSFDIVSAPGRGAKAIVTVPLNEEIPS